MKIVIKDTGSKGKGVFAVRKIKKGQVILTHNFRSDRRVYKKDIPNLSEKDQNHIDYIGDDKYAVGYSPIFMMNHSCKPNAFVKYETFLLKKVIAMKNIEKGEEIFLDYSIDTTGTWKMKCLCGKENCRKTIYGTYKKLPRKLQKKYWKYVPKWKKDLLKY